jgi:hypothetical protein
MDWRYPTVPCQRCGQPVHQGNVIHAYMPAVGNEPGEGERPLWVCPDCFLAKVRTQQGATSAHTAA